MKQKHLRTNYGVSYISFCYNYIFSNSIKPVILRTGKIHVFVFSQLKLIINSYLLALLKVVCMLKLGHFFHVVYTEVMPIKYYALISVRY